MKMGYHLSDGHWKRKISGQKVVESSSEDEEEETEKQQPNIEFVTDAEAPVQDVEVQRKNETQIPVPSVVTPAPTLAKAFTSEPLVSQTFI